MTTMTKPTYEELDRACMACARKMVELREELAACEQKWIRAQDRFGELTSLPRYSTDAVDALLGHVPRASNPDGLWERELNALVEAVRASREPPL